MSTPRTSLMRKRAARLAAAQALYASAMRPKISKPEKLITQVMSTWKASKTNEAADLPYGTQPEMPLITKLVVTAFEHKEKIEEAIEAIILPQWKKSRMSLPLLATLRTCAAEAIAYPKKPRAMLTKEYTAIAAQLTTDEEVAYAHKGFNLLLDALRA